jgi:hypothetical protein
MPCVNTLGKLTVHIDVLDANLILDAEIGVNLGNIHFDTSVSLNIVLASDYVCHLLDVVVSCNWESLNFVLASCIQ